MARRATDGVAQQRRQAGHEQTAKGVARAHQRTRHHQRRAARTARVTVQHHGGNSQGQQEEQQHLMQPDDQIAHPLGKTGDTDLQNLAVLAACAPHQSGIAMACHAFMKVQGTNKSRIPMYSNSGTVPNGPSSKH
jgi:hypothetical protein